MNKKAGFLWLACALAQLASVAWAERLPLSQAPVVHLGKPPAPNVIVSIDDSGSMLYSVDAEAFANRRQEESLDTRMAIVRAALQQAFAAENIPDHSIRLAWMAMNRCDTIPSATGGCNHNNALKTLDAEHRQTFLDWVAGVSVAGDRLRASGGTPAHKMLFNAGSYLKNNPQPWLNDPTNSHSGTLACRRTYNIFMSDGGWNSHESMPASGRIGNFSNQAKVLQLPDGVDYDIANRQLAIYRDRARFPNGYWATAWNWPTLSDLAFYFWATDLSGLGRHVEPKIVERLDRPIAGERWSIEPYWNPANNVATWQHMSMYSVGFGVGANWAALGATPVFGSSTWSGGDYDALLAGRTRWIDPYATRNEVFRMPELWHMAINSRGKYTPVTKAEDLAPAIHDILGDIIEGNQLPMASVALSAATTRADSLMFTAAYNPADWTGYVQAHTIKAGDASFDTDNQPWGGQHTAHTMAAQGAAWYRQRRVLSARGDGVAIDWTWPQLDAAQHALLNGQDLRGEDRLQYLRGDQSKELGQSGGVFRQRESIHGDVVNSQIWFLPGNHYRMPTKHPDRPDVLYVGANDGMLHAFNAANGQELLAYVPKGLLNQLPGLTEPSYPSKHRYFVDGSPFTGDVFTQPNNPDGSVYTGQPKTYLAGFLGAGGRGYFLLDVTAPQRFSTAAAQDILVMDQSLADTEQFEPDDAKAFIGHIMGEPVTDQVDERFSNQLVRMNDGRWALVMGNGYNSQNEQAALLIQFLEGSKELLVIPASVTEPIGSSNGMSAPRLIDLNHNGAVDLAYAGDLLGNLWKFDLTSAEPSQWRSAFSGAPLFQAQRSGANADVRGRAITTAPAFALHPNGGILLMVGTGRLLTDSDRSSIGNEYIVAIRDASSYSTPATAVAVAAPAAAAAGASLGTVQLVEDANHRVAWQDLVEHTTVLQSEGWNLSTAPVDYASKKGWWFQLPVAGSRVVANSRWLIGEQFRVPIVLPAQGGSHAVEETCDPQWAASTYYQATLAMRSAAPPVPPPVCDANGNSCQEWQQHLLIKPDLRALRAPPLRDPSGFLRDPGMADAEPLFTIEPLTPSWRPIR